MDRHANPVKAERDGWFARGKQEGNGDTSPKEQEPTPPSSRVPQVPSLNPPYPHYLDIRPSQLTSQRPNAEIWLPRLPPPPEHQFRTTTHTSEIYSGSDSEHEFPRLSLSGASPAWLSWSAGATSPKPADHPVITSQHALNRGPSRLNQQQGGQKLQLRVPQGQIVGHEGVGNRKRESGEAEEPLRLLQKAEPHEEGGAPQQASYRRTEEENRRSRWANAGRNGGVQIFLDPSPSPFFGAPRDPPPTDDITQLITGHFPPPAWTLWGATPTPTPPTSTSARLTSVPGSTSMSDEVPFRPPTSIVHQPECESMGSGVPDLQSSTSYDLVWRPKQADSLYQKEENREMFKREQGPPRRSPWTSGPATPTSPKAKPSSTREAMKGKEKLLGFRQREANDSTSGTAASEDLARISALRTQVLLVCSEQDSYRSMLLSRGKKAQRWLDMMQAVLDYGTGVESPAEWGSVLKALLRLSKSTGLYPRCLHLSYHLRKSGEPVAEGAFGEVYRGTVKNREVAVKVFRVYETTNLDRFKKAIWKEAILWCQLYHVNVLPCYGVHHLSADSPRVGLVSPWVDGGNVGDYLRRNVRANRQLLLSDIISGMSYLHGNKIVHGDLKGANILVTNSGRACLADFGLSVLSDPSMLHWTSIRTTAKGLGTTRWQAPELLVLTEDEVEVNATRESDIYSFGCVCYEVMTGKLPFYKVKREYAIPMIVSQGTRPQKPEPLDASFQEYGLTEPLWSLMEMCWRARPDERPTSLALQENVLFTSLVDLRPLQRWGEVSATKFRRRIMPLPNVE